LESQVSWLSILIDDQGHFLEELLLVFLVAVKYLC
jgi:hypothetical protein